MERATESVASYLTLKILYKKSTTTKNSILVVFLIQATSNQRLKGYFISWEFFWIESEMSVKW